MSHRRHVHVSLADFGLRLKTRLEINQFRLNLIILINRLYVHFEEIEVD